jgi:hypothetical protein
MTIILSGIFSVLYSQNTDITYVEAPYKIHSYVSKSFPKSEVIQYKTKNLEHEVLFSDGVKLYFNNDLQIVKIESQCKLPDTAVQPEIVKFVQENYPEEYVREWELNGDRQEIRLKYDKELSFNLSGELIAKE